MNEDWEGKKWRHGDESLWRSLSVKESRERAITEGGQKVKEAGDKTGLLSKSVFCVKDPLWAVSAETCGLMMSNDGFSTFVLHADTYHGSTEDPS